MNPIKIAIVGPESTGKSALTEELSAHYKTAYVPEIAREYLEHLHRPYEEKDLLEIAIQQCKREDWEASSAKGLLICDTNLLVIKIWSEFKYRKCDPWIVSEENKRSYDLILLMDIDLPWESDPLREHPDQRKELFSIYYRSLIQKNTPFKIVFGMGDERLKRAIKYVDALLRH